MITKMKKEKEIENSDAGKNKFQNLVQQKIFPLKIQEVELFHGSCLEILAER